MDLWLGNWVLNSCVHKTSFQVGKINVGVCKKLKFKWRHQVIMIAIRVQCVSYILRADHGMWIYRLTAYYIMEKLTFLTLILMAFIKTFSWDVEKFKL